MLPHRHSTTEDPGNFGEHSQQYHPKMLLVDDDPASLQLLRLILKADGYEVYEAYDGEQALMQFTALSLDLILLDHFLPKKDGLTLLTELRQLDQDVGILMCSALDSRILVAEAMRLGADGYLYKPFSLKTLRLRIRTILEKAQARSSPEALQISI